MLKQQQEKVEIQESGAPLAMSTPLPSDGIDLQVDKCFVITELLN